MAGLCVCGLRCADFFCRRNDSRQASSPGPWGPVGSLPAAPSQFRAEAGQSAGTSTSVARADQCDAAPVPSMRRIPVNGTRVHRVDRVRAARIPSPRRAHTERLESRTLLAAAPIAAGAEFRVNTSVSGSQELFAEAPHAVAADADGDFVVAWSSSGQDGSSWGVYAQRYAADGVARGAEFRVNQATSNSQWHPNVASDGAGNFVVAWTSNSQDGGGDGVYARRFSAAGAPLGDEFRVNTTSTGDQRHPSIAMASNGAFAVTWSGYAQLEGAGWDVYAQRFTAAGTAAGPEFRVNATTAGDQQFGAASADDAGNLVVTWTTDGQDGSGTAVYARRFSAAGAPLNGEFRVNTATAGNQHYSRVAADADGDFVVAWASANQDGSGRGIYAQRYSAAGAKQGAEFLVNQVTAGEQFAPTVAIDNAGRFLVTWTGAQDGDLFGVFARGYDAAGLPRGDEFRVNTYRAGNQVYSAAAAAGDGKLVVVWQSDGQDGNFFGVYGQRYAGPDSIAPSANVTDVAPDPRNTAVSTLTVAFTEAVTGVDVADFTLTRDGGANLLTAAQTVTASLGGLTWTLANLAPLTAADGTYVLTLKPTGTGITDAAGNVLAGGATDQWVVETVRPTGDVIDVAPDPRESGVDALTLRFSERVTGVQLADLRLTRDGLAPNLLTASQTLTTLDNVTYTLTNLAALTGAPGQYTLTLVAAGSGIADAAGNALVANAADTWTVTIPPPAAQVVGRHVFYNGSAFDAGPTPGADDAAIAFDKQALLPGAGRGGFANYTSYTRGLNGVMIDVVGLATAAASSTGPSAAAAPALSPADFAFRFGNTADAAQWSAAPAPASIQVRPGAGANGSDRVTLTWSDGAIARGWLQLSLLATAATRLTTPDVFYFGNLPGETGDATDSASVDATDVARTRAAMSPAAAALDSAYDHNRDGRVDVRDLYTARAAVGTAPLPLIGTSAASSAVAPSTPARRSGYRPAATSLLSE